MTPDLEIVKETITRLFAGSATREAEQRDRTYAFIRSSGIVLSPIEEIIIETLSWMANRLTFGTTANGITLAVSLHMPYTLTSHVFLGIRVRIALARLIKAGVIRRAPTEDRYALVWRNA